MRVTVALLFGLSALLAQVGAPATVTVALAPHPGAVGTESVVSFGLPLPPGLLQDAAQVVVRNAGGQEIPAYVRSLGPWRSIPPAKFLCSALPTGTPPGLRGVLIQFRYLFPSTNAVNITVELNRTPAQRLSTESPVRGTWRLVNEGTYSSSQQIYEPRVYALLPPQWLVCSNLTTLGSVSGAHPFLATFDQGQSDFFSTVINDFNAYPDPAALIAYLTDYEPWLYDRAQTFYNGYIRTGRLDFLREGHRAAQHYMSLLYRSSDCPASPTAACQGFFKLKNPDPYGDLDAKYSYGESLATLYWLTGDPETLPRFAEVAAALKAGADLSLPMTGSRYFTERHYGIALSGTVADFEVTGSAASAQLALQGIGNLEALQKNPRGGSAPNGCFIYVPEETPTEYGFSPWMSSLMMHALARTYHSLGDPRIPPMMVWLAQCVAERALYFPEAVPHWMPRYLGRATGPPTPGLWDDPYSDYEHAIDVAYLTAMGAHFSTDPNLTDRLLTATNLLLRSHSYSVQVWTRPTNWPGNGQAVYRVSPPRKYAWQYKNSSAIGTVLSKNPAELAGLTFGFSVLGGGTSNPGDVSLLGPAASGGVVVTLTSSNPAVASVPSSVVVPAGQTNVSLTMTTAAVAATTEVVITAYCGARTKTFTLTVEPVKVIGLSLSPPSTGGGSVTSGNLVTLNAPAAGAGAVVNLASSNPAVAAVPATVMVAPGARSATFTITTAPVPGPTAVIITAEAGARVTAELTVRELAVKPPSLSPSTVAWNSTTSGHRVVLNGPAGAGGASVSLSSGNQSVASVPSTVFVPQGQTSASFPITTPPSASPSVTVPITAQWSGSSQGANLTVRPGRISLLTLNPTSITGGSTTTANRATIDVPAPAGGAQVLLASLDTAVASVPASVTIPEGATSATFAVTAQPVSGPSGVYITAQFGGVTRGVPLTVTPGAGILLKLSPSSVAGGAVTTANYVMLSSPAPAGGALVTLSSSNVGVATVPETVSVPAGSSSAGFSIQTVLPAQTTVVTITARLGSSSATANLTVESVGLLSISLSPASFSGGGVTTSNTVKLNGPAPQGGIVVGLSSSNTDAAAVPGTVTVPAGSSSAKFAITVKSVTAATTATIAASYGTQTMSAVLTVNPARLTRISLSPSILGSGATSTGNTASLSGTAPPGGVVVALSVSNADLATLPPSVTVPAGSSSAKFNLTAGNVTQRTTATVSGTYGGVTSTATLTIDPLKLSSLSLSPSAVSGGRTTTGNRVSLNGPALAGGAVVSLASSNPAAAVVGATVTVPAGASSATFPITVRALTATDTTSISASFAGSTLSATLIVNPPALASLSIYPTSTGGGNTTTGNRVTLTGTAPAGGTMVTLASSNQNAATVPATVTVPAGSGSMAFPIVTKPVAANTTVTVAAWAGGITRTNTLTVLPLAPTKLTLYPATVSGGATTTGNRITLNAPAPADGMVVALASSNPDAATVGPSVTVPAGATSAAFPVTVKALSTPAVTTIRATLGAQTVSANLTVNPPVLYALSLSPVSVIGAATTSAHRVILSGTAPPGGSLVLLSSSNPDAATVPASVTVPGGANLVTFPVSSKLVSVASTTIITASAGGQTRQATFTVNPIALTSIPVRLSAACFSCTSRISSGWPRSSSGTPHTATRR